MQTTTTEYLGHTIEITGDRTIRAFSWTVIHPDGTTHTDGQRYKADGPARQAAIGYLLDRVQPEQVEIAEDRFSAPEPAKTAAVASSRSSYPRHADQAGGYMAGMFGLTSPASRRGECHYCGLPLRNGECDECQ